MDTTSLLLTILVVLVGAGIYLLWNNPVTPPPPTSNTIDITPTYTYSLSPFYPANYGYNFPYYSSYYRPWRWGNRYRGHGRY